MENAEKITLTTADGREVPCLVYAQDAPEGVVLVSHGFASSKDGTAAVYYAQAFAAQGFAVVAFDHPGHGESPRFDGDLRIANCLENVKTAEAYALKRWPGVKLCYFSSSFGAYINTIYLTTVPHAGTRSFFRSGAVNMPDVVRTFATEKATAELLEKGWVDIAMPGFASVRITQGFLDDLAANDLGELMEKRLAAEPEEGFPETEIMMAHGTADETIDPYAAYAFSLRFGIPLLWFEGDGHSLRDNPGTAEAVAISAAEFFRS